MLIAVKRRTQTKDRPNNGTPKELRRKREASRPTKKKKTTQNYLVASLFGGFEKVIFFCTTKTERENKWMIVD